jgi:primosomal protein N' (replication factor Y)
MQASTTPGPAVAPIVRVAVPSPLRRSFDYRIPESIPGSRLVPGARVRVPFGRGSRIGVVVERAPGTEVDPERLKAVTEVLDEAPLLPGSTLQLLVWASTYYCHPVGEVLQAALPAALRRGGAARGRVLQRWRLTAAGRTVPADALARAPRQAAVARLLAAYPEGIPWDRLRESAGDCRNALRALAAKGWVQCERVQCPALPPPAPAALGTPVALEPAQAAAVDAVYATRGEFRAFLLHGVTGSGKTEVYLRLIERMAGLGRQVLLLVPEIGLTPQMVGRFLARLRVPVAVLHSGLSDEERLGAWLMARDGRAPVVVGTRSAIFVPLSAPGLYIVDEEHDLSFKQQEGFRYSARDLAVVRARRDAVPVLLGSATPSLESLHNAAQGRYQALRLPARAAGATEPRIDIIDLRGRPFAEGLSTPMREAVAEVLARGEQALLFLNRRGYAPVLICHACGWVADCARCDAHLVHHRAVGCLRCHHCGAERPAPMVCPECGGADLRALGVGTERVVQALAVDFPSARIARFDRDSTRRKGTLETVLEAVQAGTVDILVGTQMLAKGHHFPRVTLVGILDADGGLFGADFRAGERMAQLIVQVAGRAGRGERPGRVLIQTHHPQHPLLEALIRDGYLRFAEAALAERREAGLPPAAALALLRGEAPAREAVFAFLEEAGAHARPRLRGGVRVLGPVPAAMERRAGRYRAQLLLESPDRGALHGVIAPWTTELESLKSARRVRWSLDVDPQEVV